MWPGLIINLYHKLSVKTFSISIVFRFDVIMKLLHWLLFMNLEIDSKIYFNVLIFTLSFYCFLCMLFLAAVYPLTKQNKKNLKLNH